MTLHFQGLYVRQHFSSYHFLLKSHAEKQNKILMRKWKKRVLIMDGKGRILTHEEYLQVLKSKHFVHGPSFPFTNREKNK